MVKNKINKMRISTKRGDQGKTSLLYGRQVDKDNPRIEACGVVDELSSFLGLAKSAIKSKKTKELLAQIQKDLLLIGTEVVVPLVFIKKLKKRINQNNIAFLELNILKIENKLKIKSSFLLPGASIVSSTLDICRSITRKLERRVVTLKRKKMIKNSDLAVYLNRLSDFLYLLGHKA